MYESTVKEFWNSCDLKTKLFNNSNRSTFVIYEGPPTANGKPGIHHVLTRTYKDCFARFKTMQGFYVKRTPGWDSHGLPVELTVQKEFNLTSKQSILDFGVDRFNRECKLSTEKYIQEWNDLSDKMCYWLDQNLTYNTSSDEYIQKVWDVFKVLYEKGLVYYANKVVPWACDSQTVLSNSEVAQGYKDVSTNSFYVLYKVNNQDCYICVWTTTPWTLPGNKGIALNRHFTYYKSQYNDKWIISLEKLSDNFTEISGDEVLANYGEYQSLFEDKVYKLYSADFVKESNTGFVHIAPAYGEDDYNLLGKALEYDDYVLDDGTIDCCSFGSINGLNLLNDYKKIEGLVKKYLGKNLLKTEVITHSYPHNWRTGKPLIYKLRGSWFVNVNDVKNQLIENNNHVNWYPQKVKHGRFGTWLENGRDWCISRERFWGTPIPLSKEGKYQKPNSSHKPQADLDNRISEVLDCWFDSGCVPFAAFEEYKKADLICEGVDQTRGWFYTLSVLGTIVKNEFPFKNVLCLGHVLDANGQKMSKSKGNAIDPNEVFENYGVDAVRWYFLKVPVGNSINFDEKEIKKINGNFINKIVNCLSFWEGLEESQKIDYNVLDTWIFSYVNNTHKLVTQSLTEFDTSTACLQLENLLESISNVWIRGSRKRTNGSKHVLGAILSGYAKLLAPFCPYLAEYVWMKLGNNTSVHMAEWGTFTTIDHSLLSDFSKLRENITALHKLRNDKNVKLKQPLSKAYLPKNFEKFKNYLLEELNVKEILWKDEIGLDFTITEELMVEGHGREFFRKLQETRKKRGNVKSDMCYFTVVTNEVGANWLKENISIFIETNNKLDIWVEAGETKFEIK